MQRTRTRGTFLAPPSILLGVAINAIWMILIQQEEHYGVLGFHAQRFYSVDVCTTMKRYRTTAIGALGDYTLELEKPLGMILEERDDNTGITSGGVYVKEVLPDGAASSSNQIVPRDILLSVDDTDVSNMDFDSVMNLFLTGDSSKVKLTLGDGLGVMNMPKNVVKQLRSQEDAFLVDSVVRQAVREIRKDGRLGDVLNVEVIIGAGAKDDNKVMVRFFAIFSTDGISTYSCNVSATGIKLNDGNDENESNTIKIISLSCAKDEGLGRTFDLILEDV